jgi:hypothetical protein
MENWGKVESIMIRYNGIRDKEDEFKTYGEEFTSVQTLIEAISQQLKLKMSH